MARRFDGANDQVNLGSDASIDGFTSRSVLAHVDGGANLEVDVIASKGGETLLNGNGWQFCVEHSAASTGHLRFYQNRATSDGAWTSPNNSLNQATTVAVAATYNDTDTANDPVFYIDATSQTVAEGMAPLGASHSDAAESLRLGENSLGDGDFTGDIGFFVYDNSILTAADVNRHRWYGMTPGGPSTAEVIMPLWTSDLKNKGTAGSAADGAATGTSVVAFSRPSVERCWGSMMGVGR